MGCATSKFDDLPAVLLCRERLHHLSQALHHRYSLAEAHLSYIHSLQSLGHSLHHFFDTAASLPPPHLNLPPHNKIANDSSGHLSSSHSNSGSHLDFQSDSEDEHLHDHGSGSDTGSGHLDLHKELEGPASGGKMVYEESGFGGDGGGGSGFGSGMGFNPYLYSSNNNGYTINYMKKHVTPSVSYEQKPVSYDTQTVQFGDPLTTSSSNYYDYFVANNNGNYNGDMSSYGPYGGLAYFEGVQRGGGRWNSGMPPQQTWPTKQQAAPPPPPPPATSSWDFINLFESIEDNHYPTYRNRTSSSRDSKDVREDEGIPDLEDDNYAQEEVKEVHGHPKLVVDEGGSSSKSNSRISSGGDTKKGGGELKRGEVAEEEAVGVSEVESGNVHRERPSASIESAPVEYEVRMVDKNVVGEDGKGDGGGKGCSGGSGGRPGLRNVFEVVKELQVQFERAANSGGELGNVLEVGNLWYQRKNAAYQG